MPNYPLPANVITGGVIEADDVATLYTAINGGLDGYNIEANSLTQANIAPGSLGVGALKIGGNSASVQQNASSHIGGAFIALSSGAFSHLPGISTDGDVATTALIGATSVSAAGDTFKPFSLSTAGAIQAIVWFGVYNGTASGTAHMIFQVWYLQASPPYDLGDGPVSTFVYALMDTAGNVVATSIAPDPPWHTVTPRFRVKSPHASLADCGGDPAKIEAHLAALETAKANIKQIADLRASLGKLATPAMKASVQAQIATLRAATFVSTPEDKNKLMAVHPHPFPGNDMTGKRVVMLDPVGKTTERIALLHDAGESIPSLIHRGHIVLGDGSKLKRSAPPGVEIVAPVFKNTQ